MTQHLELARAAASLAQPLTEAGQLAPLIESLSKARVVMLGEASHGTHEFYEWRREISQVLIRDHGFHFIAVEGDWPPCRQVHDTIHGRGHADPIGALQAFHRWPTWMWANAEMVTLIRWLKEHNDSHPRKAGFYGLDVYSLFESMSEVLRQLRHLDPHLAAEVRSRYSCFERFQRDEKAYARSLLSDPRGCEVEVVEALKELLRLRLHSGNVGSHTLSRAALFDVQQNARIVANAEDYYRTMVLGGVDSWNVRDRHMLETLEILLNRYGANSKAIVWAHNSHVGDHRATDMVLHGQVNIGGLARQKWGEEQVALVGFGTHRGEVIAAHAWGGAIEKMPVPPGIVGSLEEEFHIAAENLKTPAFFLDLNGASRVFTEVKGHRAIGVVYNPALERHGNYVPTSLANRYDAFVFIDQTTALTPFDLQVAHGEFPETWPGGA
jgi:erythromycin esterase-like protein